MSSNIPESRQTLRPYHVPTPTISPQINTGPNATSRGPSVGSSQANQHGLGSSARDLFSDLDYSDYLSEASPSFLGEIKRLLDEGLWKYTSVLMAQPFELAKVILQVQDASTVTGQEEDNSTRSGDRRRHKRQYDLSSDDSDDDSQSYFTSAAPSTSQSTRHPRHKYPSSQSRSSSPPTPRSRRKARSPQTPSQPQSATLSTSSITAVLSRLWREEGAWGVWKGTNSTFWHSVLVSAMSSFLRSFLCAAFALPDPSHTAFTSLPSSSPLTRLDVLSSPSPWLSLFASVSASGIAGLILAPLDMTRTKLILTAATDAPRSILATMRSLGLWVLPASIVPVTFFHSILPTLISTSIPLVLRSRLGIDPVITPTAYTIATFLSQTAELGIRLPVETVLRRGQMAAVDHRAPEQMQTTIKLGPYKGLLGTMYHIVNAEGTRDDPPTADTLARSTGTATKARAQSSPGRQRKGQGLEGLYRGWRVGAWGLVGIWGASFVGGGPSGGAGEF